MTFFPDTANLARTALTMGRHGRRHHKPAADPAGRAIAARPDPATPFAFRPDDCDVSGMNPIRDIAGISGNSGFNIRPLNAGSMSSWKNITGFSRKGLPPSD